MRNTEALLIGVILFAGTLPALNFSFLYNNQWIAVVANYVKPAGIIALGIYFLRQYEGKEYATIVICFMLSALLNMIFFGANIFSVALHLVAIIVFSVLLIIRPLKDKQAFSWQIVAQYALSLVLLAQIGAVFYIQFMMPDTDVDEVTWLPKINIAVMGLVGGIKFNEQPLGRKANYEAALLNLVFVYAFLNLLPYMSN